MTDGKERAMIPLLKETAGRAVISLGERGTHRMKVYRTAVMNQMMMDMYMCSMCMCCCANFSDMLSQNQENQQR